MRSDQIAQDCIQSGFRNLQAWRLNSLPEQPFPTLGCCNEEKASPSFKPELLLFYFVLSLAVLTERMSAFSDAGLHRSIRFSLLSTKTSWAFSAKLVPSQSVSPHPVPWRQCLPLQAQDFTFVLAEFCVALVSPLLHPA